MKISDVSKSIGKSKTHVYRTLNDDSYNKNDFGKIVTLLNFEEETLTNMFTDERFLELCEVGISKARSPVIRDFSSNCKALHLYLKGKKK